MLEKSGEGQMDGGGGTILNTIFTNLTDVCYMTPLKEK